MPPPPPSPSYNLVLDSSSDEDEDDDREVMWRENGATAVAAETLPSATAVPSATPALEGSRKELPEALTKSEGGEEIIQATVAAVAVPVFDEAQVLAEAEPWVEDCVRIEGERKKKKKKTGSKKRRQQKKRQRDVAEAAAAEVSIAETSASSSVESDSQGQRVETILEAHADPIQIAEASDLKPVSPASVVDPDPRVENETDDIAEDDNALGCKVAPIPIDAALPHAEETNVLHSSSRVAVSAGLVNANDDHDEIADITGVHESHTLFSLSGTTITDVHELDAKDQPLDGEEVTVLKETEATHFDGDAGADTDEEGDHEDVLDGDDLDTDVKIDPAKKRRKNKKKKTVNKKRRQQKKKRAEMAAEETVSALATEDKKSKKVTFGIVKVRECRRLMDGSCGVPGDGGWPLGLSDEVVREYSVEGDVDGFESRKQDDLRLRWQSILAQKGSERATIEASKVDCERIWETRQYDYRSTQSSRLAEDLEDRVYEPFLRDAGLDDGRNPIFMQCVESERKELLLRDDDVSEETAGLGEPPSSPRGKHRKGRSRSSSIVSDVSSEHYDSTDIMHVRNELETIRNHRTFKGALGCTCRKLVVVVPPPGSPDVGKNGKKSGAGGKGANKQAPHHKGRMTERKVRDELRKRGLLDPAADRTACREELELRLRDAVDAEPCCWGDDCPCVRNGIGCQSDACSCWHVSEKEAAAKRRRSREEKSASQIGEVKSAASTDEPSTATDAIKKICGNRYGMYSVDFEKVQEYRCYFIEEKATKVI